MSESTSILWPGYELQTTGQLRMPFAPASLRFPPVVCMVCGCLVENTEAGMRTHERWHDVLSEGGIGA